MKTKLTYVGIRVRDLEKSVGFYAKILGMSIVNRSKIKETKGECVTLQTEKDGFILELNYYDKDSPYNTPYVAGEGLDHIAFKVDNLAEFLKETEKEGYRTILQVNADGSKWAYIEDPDGLWIELF